MIHKLYRISNQHVNNYTKSLVYIAFKSNKRFFVAEDDEKEKEEYNEDADLSDQLVEMIKKNSTKKRKSTIDHMGGKRKRIVKKG